MKIIKKQTLIKVVKTIVCSLNLNRVFNVSYSYPGTKRKIIVKIDMLKLKNEFLL